MLIYTLTDAGKRGTDHEAEEHASSDQRHDQGHWMGATAGTEGLHNIWTIAEGDRKSWDYNTPCYYKSCE